MLVVTKLDRLARSVPHLCAIGSRLDAKGVGLKVLDQAIDPTTSTGRLMFNMLGAIAQFERELIRERMLASPRLRQRESTKAESRQHGCTLRRSVSSRRLVYDLRRLHGRSVSAAHRSFGY